MALSEEAGSYQDFSYTGGMQEIVIPRKGIYKFEVWGAGGTTYGGILESNDYWSDDKTSVHWLGKAGAGGYTVGHRICESGEKYYICVGGSGTLYNGGAQSVCAGRGGGATHIAKRNAQLRDMKNTLQDIMLVAGGGGGAGQCNDNGNGHTGGGKNGGGSSLGGTQTSGGVGHAGSGNGTFGAGGRGIGEVAHGGSASGAGGGGGGGYYGGAGGYGYIGGGAPGGGGSGYIGMPTITATDGTVYKSQTLGGGGSAQNTHGRARVTFLGVDKLPVFFDGVQLTRIYFNGTRINDLKFNSAKIF